jgi:hypothetical protein
MVSKFVSQTLVQFGLEIGENSIRSRVLGTVLSRSAAPHDVASRRAALRALTATRCARSPRPPLGPERRGSLAPAGPCVVGPPASNRHPDPLPVHHVLTPAVSATQRRHRRTRAVRPLVGNWPPCVAAHPAVHRPCHAFTSSPSPWCARKHSTASSWAIKPAGLLLARKLSRRRPP